MNHYPAQFQTSNNRFYKDHHLPATSRSISITNHLSNEPFEGITRYNESYKWVQVPKIVFGRPVERHTGPIKLNIRDTQYQRSFIKHSIQQGDRYERGKTVQGLQASFDTGSVYRSAFKQHLVTGRSNTCKKRRLEDLQSMNQFQVPFEAKSQSSRAYNCKRIVLCPAKFVK